MNRFLVTLTLASAVFLAFFGGILVGEYNARPFYGMLGWAFRLADTVCDRPLGKELLVSSGLWHSARSDREGVVCKTPKKMYGEYSLLTSANAQEALLMDADGKTVHKWSLPFRAVWEHPLHIKEPAESGLIFWRSVSLYPNGDLLVSYASADDPRGYGLAKIDAQSNVIWTFDERTAGTFLVQDNGKIKVLVKTIGTTPVPRLPQMVCPYIQDEIVTLSTSGEVLSRINLLDSVVSKLDEKSLCRLPPGGLRGILGCVSVDRVNEALARKIADVEAGDMLVSMQNAGFVVVVDSATGKINWLTGGPWQQQSGAKVNDSGNIVIFDTDGQRSRGFASAVIEIDPLAKKVVRLYIGDKSEPLNSRRWGDLHVLPNQNVLVTESAAGTVLELSPENQVVWKWINPVRAGKNDTFIPCVWSATRYAKELLDFDFNEGRI
ncbi:MAG: hypothetical protein JXR25_04115 [Pontiellaceae bacterium]|nr:hypothetical protein [Pontiellaceae bacterium]MBN2783988.1 hypothetical protein [Pontiellaceae bacterium]